MHHKHQQPPNPTACLGVISLLKRIQGVLTAVCDAAGLSGVLFERIMDLGVRFLHVLSIFPPQGVRGFSDMQISGLGSCKVLLQYFNVAEIMFLGLDLKLTRGSGKPLFAVRFEAAQVEVATFPLVMPNSEQGGRIFVSPAPGAGGGYLCSHALCKNLVSVFRVLQQAAFIFLLEATLCHI